jgi:cbb3-type cytochrome oxidase subunit 1
VSRHIVNGITGWSAFVLRGAMYQRAPKRYKE